MEWLRGACERKMFFLKKKKKFHKNGKLFIRSKYNIESFFFCGGERGKTMPTERLAGHIFS